MPQSPTMTESSPPDTIQLVEDTRRALQGLRSALIELYGAIQADPEARQDVVRRFGLNKNLSWKLSRVISAPDAFASLNHLPGQQGLQLALEAFETAGAPRHVLDRARTAVEQFGEVVSAHADDREHLELTLESMGLFEREAATAGGRELAFRGNSMIWGVQARTRVALTFLGPSTEGPDLAHSITAYGFTGIRRLRANARWRLFDQGLTDDVGNKPQFLFRVEPLDPGADGNPASMLYEFCSPNTPALEVTESRALREYWLPAGQVGNKASFDLFRGHITRNVPLYQTPGSKVGFYAASITLPVQDLVFDYIVHRDIGLPLPTVSLFGVAPGSPDNPSIQTPQNQLPIAERLKELVGSPPALATPLAPAVSRIAERIYTRLGWNPDEFVGYRLHVPYPPMSSRVILQWPLRVREG